MLNKHEKDLRKIVELYRIIKELTLFTEQVNFKIDVQASMELRNAFDHFMRAMSSELSIQQKKDAEYIKRQIDKVCAHVIRSGYDTLDTLGIEIKKSIIDEMRFFSLETINVVWPEYYRKERGKMMDIVGAITSARFNKDSGDDDLNNFLMYAEKIKESTDMYKKLLQKKGDMIEYQKKLKEEKLKKRMFAIIKVLFIGLIGYLFAWLQYIWLK